ncbi:MAG: YggT family protein [Actinomycetia bacterium]|nr:YggT family protein [Actinomycetes bacterium]
MALLAFAFGVINYLLAAVFWTLMGRALLSIFLAPDNTNYIWRFFCRITNPVIRLITPLTPQFFPPRLVPIYAGFYVMLARFLMLFSWLLLLYFSRVPDGSWDEALMGAGFFALLDIFTFQYAFVF